ncbi:hypothetical protein LJC54_07110, partial [Parabacteroides sp. OttesenSCG-928-J18]|nr:hypothetical protein [Parabacteroides sp. OttesenSCG-928-J18]
ETQNKETKDLYMSFLQYDNPERSAGGKHFGFCIQGDRVWKQIKKKQAPEIAFAFPGLIL